MAVAPSPAEAVEGAEVVVTRLADGRAVEETVRDALPALAEQVVWEGEAAAPAHAGAAL